MNSRKHLIFANEIVADGEDKELYYALMEELLSELKPETLIERSICERMVAIFWRERRLAVAERILTEEAARDAQRSKILNIDLLPETDDDGAKVVGALEIGKQFLVGRYQVMLTNQIVALLKQ